LGGSGAVVSRFTGARSVIRVAGDEIRSRINIGLYADGSKRHQVDAFGEYIGFNLADAILVMSEEERERVAQRLVDRHDRIKVCPRGIDLASYSPAEGFDTPYRRTVFSYVGRRSPEKGYDLIEAAAEL